MHGISDDLLYTLNLPVPPAFTLSQDSKSIYRVPDFFGYESPSTRWIIALLSNRASLQRLIKCGRSFEHIFTRYYQIPDRPMEVMGTDYPLETPAFHMQTILYLTPLALALYMKQIFAVETLMELKNDSGRKMVHPAETCFIQRVFKKGDKRYSNELFNTFPIVIAIRRSFFEGIGLLVENGFTPQKQFTVLYRRAFKETVSLYRDVVDYIVDLLRNKPGLNVAKIMRMMLDTSVGLTTYDIFVYDIELDDQNSWDYVSIFRRICRIGYGTKYFIEESTTQILNILEQIQMIGYFGGVRYLKIYFNGSLPTFFEKHLSKEVIEELQSERLSYIMDKIPLIIKAGRDDLFKLDATELQERMDYDYQCCVGILFLWYQRCLLQERCYHFGKLACILARIMIDTKIVEDFFVKSDKELAGTFSEWCQDHIRMSTVFNFRVRMQDYILFKDTLCVAFILEYGQNPCSLLNAPMLYGKHVENSAVIRDMMSWNKFTTAESSTNNLNSNQSNLQQNPMILNVSDPINHFSIKLIPANHAKTFALGQSLETSHCRHTRHSSMNQAFQKPKKNSNNANDLDALETLSENEDLGKLYHTKAAQGNSNFPLPAQNEESSNQGSGEVMVYIKSPSENDQKEATTKKTRDYFNASKPFTDVMFRPKIPTEYRRKQSYQSPTKKLNNCHRQESIISAISDEELTERVKRLVATNDKYKDIRIHKNGDKVPLKSLRSQIRKYKSTEKIIEMIQSKHSSQLDSLYNNLDANNILETMKQLSQKTNSCDSKTKNEFSHVFQF